MKVKPVLHRNTAGADWQALHRRLQRSRDAIESLLEPRQAEQDRILAKRATALAKSVTRPEDVIAPGEEIDVLIFQAAGERYAFEARHVEQVLPMSSITPLPGVPKFVVGMIAAQGEVLSVIDLRVLLDLPLSRLSEPNSIIVLKGGAMEFGVLAEEILGFWQYQAGALAQGATALTNNDRLYLKGVASDRTAILDAEQLLSESSPVIVAG